MKLFTSTSLAAMLLATTVLAQDQQQQQTAGQAASQAGSEVVVLSAWRYDPLYTEGRSVERIFDETEVFGPGGEEIGSVENIIFSNDGQALAVIAELGGFLDIGDTHVSIPWDEVQLSANADTMTIPVTEDNADDYSVFKKGFFFKADARSVSEVDDDLATGPEVFKATDLIGDYAYLNDDVQYGYVNDIVLSDGRISAVVVDASAFNRPGYYAYPYRGYGAVPPAGSRYDLPYSADEVTVLNVFDYDRLQPGMAVDEGTTSSMGGNVQSGEAGQQ